MNPNDYIGMSVIVSPKEDDLFPVFKGTVMRVDDPYFKVAIDSEEELDRYIYDVEFDQLTFIENYKNHELISYNQQMSKKEVKQLFKKDSKVYIKDFDSYGKIDSKPDYDSGSCYVTLDTGNKLRRNIYNTNEFFVVS